MPALRQLPRSSTDAAAVMAITTGAGVFRAPFEPLIPQWSCVPFNDLGQLENVCKNNDIAAVVIEPIQVESGVRQASDDFMQTVRACCDRSGALLVLDEVQTGLGRTGSAFAFQQCGVTPDVIALAKALGAGVVPIGATLARKGLFHRAYGSYERCEAHNSTYGGNALACSVALAAVDAMLEPALLANARTLGETLAALCNEHLRDHTLVKGWRFHGLLGAMEMHNTTHPWFDWSALGMPEWRDKPSTGALLVHRLHRRGFLLQLCGHDWNCLRIEPPLIINETDCRELIAAVKTELDWIASYG